ncbi:MAG: GlsB/YeaQ/YmgE family stress response membrane protein [Rhizobiales bacterium]|nr:GlsB/YeaQ/YmgE family stress response membrane protein [Hyphomicrobiales bacterium]
MTDVLWTIGIGFVAGLIAKFLMPGKNEPKGFVLTALLGIAGAFVGTFLGQFVGYLRPGEQGNFVVSIIGAIAILFFWGWLAQRQQAS